MDKSLDDKLARLIISAILQSDIASSDFQAVAKTLNSKSFSANIANSLKALTKNGSKSKGQEQRVITQEAELPDGDELAEIIKRRKVTKSEFVRLVDSLVDVFLIDQRPEDLTVRELSQKTVDHLKHSQLKNLVSMLEGGSTQDPFLKKIMQRR